MQGLAIVFQSFADQVMEIFNHFKETSVHDHQVDECHVLVLVLHIVQAHKHLAEYRLNLILLSFRQEVVLALVL